MNDSHYCPNSVTWGWDGGVSTIVHTQELLWKHVAGRLPVLQGYFLVAD